LDKPLCANIFFSVLATAACSHYSLWYIKKWGGNIGVALIPTQHIGDPFIYLFVALPQGKYGTQ